MCPTFANLNILYTWGPHTVYHGVYQYICNISDIGRLDENHVFRIKRRTDVQIKNMSIEKTIVSNILLETT